MLFLECYVTVIGECGYFVINKNMKRELSTSLPEAKRARIEYNPKLNELMSLTTNELETECTNITRKLRDDIPGTTLALLNENAVQTLEAAKQRAVHMCRDIYFKKLRIDTDSKKHCTLTRVSQTHTGEQYAQMVSSMWTIQTTDAIEDNLIRQMNIISEECRLDANIIDQARTDGKAKMSMWRHIYMQLKAVRTAKSLVK